MRVIVVGAGAIGAGVGGALARVGVDVHLVARGARLEALAAGLHWQTPDHDERLSLPVSDGRDLEPQPGDTLWLTTKLQDAEAALDQLGPRWRQTPVVVCTNGIHGQRWAMARHDTVLSAVMNVPASTGAADRARLWGRPHFGAVHVGVVQGEARALRDELVSVLDRAGFEGHGHDDVWPYVHGKWLTNLMGIAQALVVPSDFEEVAMAAMAEGAAVLAAAGIEAVPWEALSTVPLELGTIDGEERGGGSTLQSLLAGRPLESPYLNGPLVALAAEVGVPAPLNEALLACLPRAASERWQRPQLRKVELPVG